MYYNGNGDGDVSEERRCERKERRREKGRRVVEKIAAVVAAWKSERSRKKARGG